MTWSLVSAKAHKITVKLATEFMEMTAVPRERLLRERRMQVYERLIRNQQWRPCIWASVHCKETGETYRVNGQHTSRLFSVLAGEFTDLTVIIESYEADTLEDVGRLYGTFDSSQNSRTASDIFRAFASTIPELADLPRKIIDSCASGISVCRSGGNPNGVDFGIPQERAENLLDHPEFVQWVAEIITDTNKYRHLCRVGVVAGMFGSYLKAKKDATEFWLAVRDETGARPTCPDRQLARFLILTSVRSMTEGKVPQSRKADTREFFVRVTHCWNAWRRSEELKLIKYHAHSKPPAFA